MIQLTSFGENVKLIKKQSHVTINLYDQTSSKKGCCPTHYPTTPPPQPQQPQQQPTILKMVSSRTKYGRRTTTARKRRESRGSRGSTPHQQGSILNYLRPKCNKDSSQIQVDSSKFTNKNIIISSQQENADAEERRSVTLFSSHAHPSSVVTETITAVATEEDFEDSNSLLTEQATINVDLPTNQRVISALEQRSKSNASRYNVKITVNRSGINNAGSGGGSIINRTRPATATAHATAPALVKSSRTNSKSPKSKINNDNQNESPKPTGENDDLTSLSWLQSLDMGGVVPHLAVPPTPPASPLGGQQQGSPEGSNEPLEPVKKIDYSVDGSVKPPYSYAALIGMAMKENDNKMTLSAIYKWIKEHFVFYKTADQSWQNSIRHNLSLNKCFLKVARSKDEPGKGGFWKLDPEYAEALVDGVFKRKKLSRGGTAPPTTKSKRKRPFAFASLRQAQPTNQQQGSKKLKREDQEELLRQKEQEEAVKSLLEPPQAAYMPPPSDKPPIPSLYICQQETIDQSLLVDESGNPLKEDFVWSTLLGDDPGQEECWQFSTQEVVTDLTHSGDPSTYQVTTTSPVSSSMSSTSTVLPSFESATESSVMHQRHQQQQSFQNVQTLPSFDLSPESLGVEENLFGSPDYSESSCEERDALIQSFDIGSVGSLDLAASSGGTTTWDNKISFVQQGTMTKHHCDQSLDLLDQTTGILMSNEKSHDFIELHDLEGNLTQLTTLEPVTPLIVQQVNSSDCWLQEQQRLEDAKTFSLLEANLDFDKLIDLDVI